MHLFSNALAQYPALAACAELLFMLIADPLILALFILLAIAAISDCRSYRIPNWLTFGGALFAIGYSMLLPSMLHPGIVSAISGYAIGLVVMLPFHALRVMGAGDVKLMAMAGAFLGAADILPAVAATFIVGGVAALAFAVYHKAWRKLLANLKSITGLMMMSAVSGVRADPRIGAAASIGRMPYGASICIGTVGFVVARQFGFF